LIKESINQFTCSSSIFSAHTANLILFYISVVLYQKQIFFCCMSIDFHLELYKLLHNNCRKECVIYLGTYHWNCRGGCYSPYPLFSPETKIPFKKKEFYIGNRYFFFLISRWQLQGQISLQKEVVDFSWSEHMHVISFDFLSVATGHLMCYCRFVFFKR
jgi:hypothetical protein